jgi:hypothetical protein
VAIMLKADNELVVNCASQKWPEAVFWIIMLTLQREIVLYKIGRNGFKLLQIMLKAGCSLLIK